MTQSSRLQRPVCLAAALTFAAAVQAPAWGDALGNGSDGVRRRAACKKQVEIVSERTRVPVKPSIVDEYVFQLSPTNGVLFHCDRYELLATNPKEPGVIAFLVGAWTLITYDSVTRVVDLMKECRKSGEVRNSVYHMTCSKDGGPITMGFINPVGL